jgi:transposase
LRETTGKKSGGQVGHAGKTLAFRADADGIIDHHPAACVCGADLSSVAAEESYERRQVWDIPQPAIEVTEHRLHRKICAHCQTIIKAEVPENVPCGVSYGANIQAWAVYLQHGQLLPEDRLSEVFRDIFGLAIRPATLVSYGEKLAKTLLPWWENTQTALAAAPVKHLDETGFRIGGKTAWLHVLSSENATVYKPEPKRGTIFTALTGTVVHDHFKPYYGLKNVHHALCNAHHLRELNACIDDKEPWAEQMKRYLLLLSRLVKKPLSQHTKNRLLRLYDAIIAMGLAYHENLPPFCKTAPKRGKTAKRRGHNLLIRLRDFKDDVLRSLLDPAVPFTNNQAERDIRMMKVKQKISGGFRSMSGAQTFATIRSLLSTTRKQDGNLLHAIANALSAQPPPVIY